VTGIEVMSHAPPARLPVPIDTGRLVLRPFELADVPCMAALLSDEEATRWTGGVRSETEAKASVLRMRDSFQRWGIGSLAVVSRESGECVGYCGVRPLAHTQDLEIAFGLLRSCWHKGFATEASTAYLQATFDSWPLMSIVATVYEENLRSIAVLKKLGMELESRIFGAWPNPFALLYRLTRDAWMRRDSAD
jgi:ribosomal-protein-alanine N-acetyltransferase